MANKQGFVFKIEIGRAGLVSVDIIHADGSRGTYVIEDLDADPERFNDRLSKLAILRDAMNRAEPVHIEHVSGEAGQVIERVARISRDELDPVEKVVHGPLEEVREDEEDQELDPQRPLGNR